LVLEPAFAYARNIMGTENISMDISLASLGYT